MSEVILTHGYKAIVDDIDIVKIKDYTWRIYSNWKVKYAVTNGYVNGKRTTIRMHRLVVNAKPNEKIDHINGNGLDNRKINLRRCTSSQNMGNISKRLGSSKYKGVCWGKKENKWRAKISYAGRQYHLGFYMSEKEAALAYNKKAKELFKEFARINIFDGDE